MSEVETARLISHLLDQALLPADLQESLLAKVAGNPLYAEEYVRMLIDRGDLRRVGGSWRLQGADQAAPATVQGIVAARLDTLDPDEKALLADAAVIGTVSWLGALAALGGTRPSALRHRLEVLERREYLRADHRSAVAGERQYSFRHVLIRDVAYAQLPRGQRADKHRRAAEWIEELAADRAEDRVDLLAHHYSAAFGYARAARQDTAPLAGRAWRACRDAGERALELNAFPAAAPWYATALEYLEPDHPARPRLLLRLGRARFHAEQAGEDVLVEARDRLLVEGDRESAAEAEVMLGKLAWLAGETEQAIERDRAAAELLVAAPPSRAKATVLVELAGLLMVAGRNQEAIQVGQEGLGIAERLGLDDIRADALNHVGAARVSTEDPGGLADMKRAVTLAERANSPLCVIAYVNLGSVYVERGDLARGFEVQAEGRRAAEREADQFIAESEAGVRHYMESACRLARGRIRLARGRQAAALEDAASTLRSSRQIRDPQVLHPALAFQANAALRAGRAGAAGAAADELLASLMEQDGSLLGSVWPSDIAAVLLALGRGNELADLATARATTSRWLEAATALAVGEPQRAADLYADIGSLPDEAFARLQAARQLLAAGHRAEGNAQLQASLAFYRTVQARSLLQEGERLPAATA